MVEVMNQSVEGEAANKVGASIRVRVVAGLVAGVCIGLIATAYVLTPAPGGVGTHEQMGLPRCGFLGAVGVPCATCGMTTAFALAVQGRIVAAIVTQPAGAAFALVVGGVGMMSLYSVWTGVGAGLLEWWSLLWRQKVVLWVGVFVVASWVYKIVQYLYFGG